MAGRGSRFAQAGFTTPKPLIPVGGRPMIEWVIENIRPRRPHRFIFLCLAEHLKTYPEVPNELRRLAPGCEIIPVSTVTEGAACTVLLARRFIDGDDPLMIANSDQIVDLAIDDYLAAGDAPGVTGLIMTFWSDHPKWSYCRLLDDGTVSEVVEKKVVSNEATVGIYNFRHGRDFVRAADAMITANLRVNNEFYVAPTYNQLIGEGAKIVTMKTGREGDGMYGLGIPEDLEIFKRTSYYLERSKKSFLQKVVRFIRLLKSTRPNDKDYLKRRLRRTPVFHLWAITRARLFQHSAADYIRMQKRTYERSAAADVGPGDIGGDLGVGSCFRTTQDLERTLSLLRAGA